MLETLCHHDVHILPSMRPIAGIHLGAKRKLLVFGVSSAQHM